MDSKIGLIVQLAGVSLITLLTLFLRRSLNVVALKHWTNAWLFLSFALFCLRLAFSYEEYSIQLFSFYFFTEYMFGFLLVSGCRSLSHNTELNIRQEAFIIPFIVVAFALPFLADDFNLVFNVHSLILSGFFLTASISLWRSKIRSFGSHVMQIALFLLFADFLQYFVVFTLRQLYLINFDYLSYNSLIDLVLQILLGFGMVIILLEQVLTDAKTANEKLKKAHERLEEIAHVDPLTAALNRHAFHGYMRKHGGEDQPVFGCVGFFDIDDLKVINDVYGHTAGDMAIRSVVRGIREIIRAEDLIFRWGGDEFFVIMISLDSAAADARMERLEPMLSNVHLEGVPEPIAIRVSHAFADFNDLNELEATIKKADAGMYRAKQQRKGQMAVPGNFSHSSATIAENIRL